MYSNLFDKILLILLSIFLLLDTVSGIFPSFSIIAVTIKVICLFAIACSLFRRTKSAILFLLVGMLCLVVITYIVQFSYIDLTLEISTLSKLLYFPLGAIYFYYLSPSLLKYVDIIVLFTYVVILLNVLLGLMGYGGHTYTALEYGYKGFIRSGNELSFLLVVAGGLLVIRFRDNFRLCMMIFFISTLVGVLIATKTSIMAFIILFAIYVLHLNLKIKVVAFLMIMVTLSLIILNLNYFISNDTFSLLYNRFENTNMLDFLLSGRNLHLDLVVSGLENKHYQFSSILGYSRSSFLAFGLDSIEMDFFDIYYWYGLVFLLFYIISIFLCLKILLNSNIKKFNTMMALYFSIIVFIAAFAGHIFTSGMVAPLLGTFIYYSRSDVYLSK